AIELRNPKKLPPGSSPSPLLKGRGLGRGVRLLVVSLIQLWIDSDNFLERSRTGIRRAGYPSKNTLGMKPHRNLEEFAFEYSPINVEALHHRSRVGLKAGIDQAGA